MPGALPKITHQKIVPPLQANTEIQLAAPHLITHTPPAATMLMVQQRQAQKTKTIATDTAPRQSTRFTPGNLHIQFCNSKIISKDAINMLIMNNMHNNTVPFTPTKLIPPPIPLINFKHYAMPMVHATIGKTKSSYKQLMNNPVIANTWQTAFGKDFGSMCQENNKTGAKGTNTMFRMKPDKVDHTPAARLATYANIVIDC
jgi:hypothetical protein